MKYIILADRHRLIHQFFKRKKEKKKVVALAEVSKKVQFFWKNTT
jgi:hypothetical protein